MSLADAMTNDLLCYQRMFWVLHHYISMWLLWLLLLKGIRYSESVNLSPWPTEKKHLSKQTNPINLKTLNY